MKESQRGEGPAADIAAVTDLATVADLMDRRARISEWLARLDEAPVSNPRAAERVRVDYRQRLEAVMSELSEHGEALREQRRHLSRALAEAEAAEQTARDELDEAELRHRIGEIQDDEWDEKRRSLEDSAAQTGERVLSIREETTRLDEVLEGIEGGIDTVPSPPADAAAQADATPVSEATENARAEAATPDPAADGDDGGGAFLDDLDRAIESSADTRPRPGTKCPECGYTNDFDAWYCGVCGVDLA
jgi:septal ring factor EnvC (AmiA/AmiB activator)